MKHKVRINLMSNGKKEPLLTKQVYRLPTRIMHAIFGDAAQIIVLKPGQTVQSMEFIELPETMINEEKE